MRPAPSQYTANNQNDETEDGDAPLKRSLRSGGLRPFRNPFELKNNIVRGLNTLIGILRQTGPDHLIDRRWRRGNRLRFVLENRSDETGLAVATESCLAGDHFIKHEAECEDIAARVGFFAVKELRRHVLNRPENLPLLGHLLDGCFSGRRLDVLFGEPEIEQLHARLREHDVRWLQIAVDDSLPM